MKGAILLFLGFITGIILSPFVAYKTTWNLGRCFGVVQGIMMVTVRRIGGKKK